MIYLVVFAIIGVVCFPKTMAVAEDYILDFLEQLRNRMCHSLPMLGLPALDPIQISHVEYDMNNKYIIDFSGSVTHFRLTGLSDFIVNDLKITTGPLRKSTLDVTLPFTAFKSLYTAKGSLAYILNLAGDGNAEALLEQLRVTATWIFKTSSTLGIRNLKIVIKIAGIYVDFEKLIQDKRINDFFHALINELGLELLDDVWKLEKEFIERILEAKLNNFLGQYSISDIIKLITSGGDNPIFGPDDPPADCKSTLPN